MPKPTIFITVDTETSIGGAFSDLGLQPVGMDRRGICRIADREWGISLIMDIADRYDIRITFFLEVMNYHYFGKDETRRICEYILKRGHDVQLHVHPNFLNFTLSEPGRKVFSDLIGAYPLNCQVEILGKAREILQSFGVPNPSVFRAGCFGAGDNTLKALSETGFLIDSSYNASYLGGPCLMADRKVNDIFYLNGVWELPITNFIEHLPVLRTRKKPMDINGSSFEEMRSVLRNACQNGPFFITIIMHSFCFVKAYDIQYRRVRPRRHVVRRFKQLCRYLSENKDQLQVKSMGSVSKEELSGMGRLSRHSIHPVPPLLSVLRGMWQIADNLL